MRIVVCVKIVPNSSNIKFDKKSNTILRDSMESIINPTDLNALEGALKLKDMKICSELIVISMGVMSKSHLLKETFALGADRVILLNDSRFSSSDTLATAYVLKKAIEKISNVNLILCGRQSLDGDTGQVGPSLASMMDIPFITNAEKIDSIEADCLCANQLGDHGHNQVAISLPGLVTVTNNFDKVRSASLSNILKAQKKEIEVWSADDIQADVELCGAKGSPTAIKTIKDADFCVKTEMLTGDICETASKLVKTLTTVYPDICVN